ncbi:hypothetical protein LZ32DRAFT_332715 [Colletotrichum eremochloae]|nr:hypothetical protein LZ32DRAFT_332715 [Colletotrichum eremochloae]
MGREEGGRAAPCPLLQQACSAPKPHKQPTNQPASPTAKCPAVCACLAAPGSDIHSRLVACVGGHTVTLAALVSDSIGSFCSSQATLRLVLFSHWLARVAESENVRQARTSCSDFVDIDRDHSASAGLR